MTATETKPTTAPSWGLVATIKAPVEVILDFAAYHLELGAAHLFIYLDDENFAAEEELAAHSSITVTRTDNAYWQETLGRRPPKHQVRQSHNARHAYAHAGALDWLAHIDVDEFLCPEQSVAAHLGTLPAGTRAARTRPAEMLATDGQTGLDPDITYCKAWMPPDGERVARAERIYPTYGRYVKGGFLSHVAGKIFLRTGQGGVDIRIHSAFSGTTEIPSVEMPEVALAHLHAPSWQAWQHHYRYRLTKGSYRAEMRPAISRDQGGLSLYELFNLLEDKEGEDALRGFFEEVCLATPEHLHRLTQEGLLRRFHLDRDRKRLKHFPGFRSECPQP
ncbi:Glycosyl transferase family 2 [Salinihabitans flavidus]|uniref:Glycosyl transferase family 2 n=1 Tax=Salinihabitans flavidus TaxID=569882 RepID=A0A1H8N8X9_9RHOB|nr:glycosyltransferase family 2 protein [Salinihabitans flavidus]SEO26060.1 Glycosyl transferase family 2 [Salinihabitans flavidus]